MGRQEYQGEKREIQLREQTKLKTEIERVREVE